MSNYVANTCRFDPRPIAVGIGIGITTLREEAS